MPLQPSRIPLSKGMRQAAAQPQMSKIPVPKALTPTTPRYTKQGWSNNRPNGSKAISQGTVTSAKVGYKEAACVLNERFKSADPIRPSTGSDVNEPELADIKELSGSGESAAMRLPPLTDSLSDEKKNEDSQNNKTESQKIQELASPITLNVLMSPKRAVQINPCISRSPFDKEYCEPQVKHSFEGEGCHLYASMSVSGCEAGSEESTPVDKSAVDLNQFLISEPILNPSKINSGIGMYACNDLKEIPGSEILKIIQNHENQDQLLLQRVLEQYENQAECIDSIEDMVPPPELHEVVSDPNFVQVSSEKVERFTDILERIEPPSLVESNEDLEKLSVETNSASDFNASQAIKNCHPTIRTIEEPVNIETSVANNNCESYIAKTSDQETNLGALNCPHLKIIEYADEEFKGIEGIFKGEEIIELTMGSCFLKNQEFKLQSENSENEARSSLFRIDEESADHLRNSSIKANIIRLEEQFLPYMIDNGLRPGLIQTYCEEVKISDEIECQKPVLADATELFELKNAECSCELMAADSAHFLVTVPKSVTMFIGVQPLTYAAKMTIKSRDSRRLTYKVLIKNRCRYAIKPVIGYIPSAGHAQINIQSFFSTYEELPDIVNDSFVVLIADAHPSNLTRKALKEYWNLLQDRLSDSVEIFKIDKVEIVCLPNRESQLRTNENSNVLLPNKNIQHLMTKTEDENATNEGIIDSPGNDLDVKMFTETAQVKQELLRITEGINDIVTWGSISLYLTSLAVIGTLVLKNVESIVIPSESEPEGWFAWIPSFGAKLS